MRWTKVHTRWCCWLAAVGCTAMLLLGLWLLGLSLHEDYVAAAVARRYTGGMETTLDHPGGSL